MSDEFSNREAVLFSKYPKLFRRVNLPMEQTCMCWGCEIPDEWMGEIETLCEQINEIAPDAFEFEQIKTKWGSIRVYYDIVSEISNETEKKIDNLVSGVEERCFDERFIY